MGFADEKRGDNKEMACQIARGERTAKKQIECSYKIV